MKAGLLTGLGSSVTDCLYACVGAFGLNLISDFLIKYQNIVNLAGGCLIVGMGIRMFASSFAVGITNPAAILTFLFAFSWFGIHGQTGLAEGIGLVCGVFIGTYIWWGTLTGAASMFRKKSKKDCLPVMNRVFRLILILFGAVILVRNFLN